MILQVALDLPARQLFDYLPHPVDPVPELGSRVLVTCAGTSRCGVVAALSESSKLPPTRLRSIEGRLGGMQPLPPELLAVLLAAAQEFLLPPGRLVMRALPPALRNPRQLEHDAPAALPPPQLAGPALPTALRHPLARLAEESQDTLRPALLAGPAGSGKAAVLAALAAQLTAAGKRILLLAPTLASADQWLERLAVALPGATVLPLHSGLGAAEHQANWHAAAAGAAHAVVGARGAVFAPLPDLGLVAVVDEHDSDHRAGRGLRYSARDVAAMRSGATRGCRLVLMSATPSLDLRHAAQTKGIKLVSLPRPANIAAPRLDTADIAGRRLFGGVSSEFEQVVGRMMRSHAVTAVLVHRGYRGGALSCPGCRILHACRHCGGLLVGHASQARCRRCGKVQPAPAACPKCGHAGTAPVRAVSGRIKEALAVRVPEARILGVSAREDLAEARKALAAGAVDVLVGGPALAALGPVFGAVVLADVDNILQSTRLSAATELLAAVASLSAQPAGCEILAQTRFGEHHLFEALRRGNYDAYALAELKLRKKAGLPPFRRWALLAVQAATADDASRFLGKARALAKPHCARGVDLFEPVPARPTSGKERLQLLVSAPSRSALRATVRPWLAELEQMPTGPGIEWDFEIDPQQW